MKHQEYIKQAFQHGCRSKILDLIAEETGTTKEATALARGVMAPVARSMYRLARPQASGGLFSQLSQLPGAAAEGLKKMPWAIGSKLKQPLALGLGAAAGVGGTNYTHNRINDYRRQQLMQLNPLQRLMLAGQFTVNPQGFMQRLRL